MYYDRLARSLYTLQEEEGAGGGGGGTFTQADVDAAVMVATGDTAGLKSKNSELLGKLEARKGHLAAIGDLTPEQVTEALTLAEKTRTDKATAAGDFETLKLQMAEKHTAELGKVTDRLGLVSGSLNHVLADQAVTLQLAEVDGNAKVLLPHITPFVKIVENESATSPGDRFSAVVVDAAGTPRVTDGTGTPMSLKALVEEFRDNDTYTANFGPGSESGSGARNQSGRQVKAHTISRADAQDVIAYRAASAAAAKAGVGLTITD